SRTINLLKFLGQSKDGNAAKAKLLQFGAGGVELSLAAIDQDQIWKRRWRRKHRGCVFTAFAILPVRVSLLVSSSRLTQQPGIPSPNRLRNAGEVILADDRFHFEPPVIGAVGAAMFETDHRSHRERVAD